MLGWGFLLWGTWLRSLRRNLPCSSLVGSSIATVRGGFCVRKVVVQPVCVYSVGGDCKRREKLQRWEESLEALFVCKVGPVQRWLDRPKRFTDKLVTSTAPVSRGEGCFLNDLDEDEVFNAG